MAKQNHVKISFHLQDNIFVGGSYSDKVISRNN